MGWDGQEFRMSKDPRKRMREHALNLMQCEVVNQVGLSPALSQSFKEVGSQGGDQQTLNLFG